MCGIDRGCKEVTFNKYLCNLVFQFHTSLCRANHVVMLDLQFYRSGATNKRGSNLEALSFSFLLSLSLSLSLFSVFDLVHSFPCLLSVLPLFLVLL